MHKRLTPWVAAAALLIALVGAPAVADDKTPDGTIQLSEGSVAAGIGWSWGRGTLQYKGMTYHFKVEGLSVAEVGITSATASGSVYNLSSLEDFGGVFAAAGAEGTAGKGRGRFLAAQRQGRRDQPEERDQGREYQDRRVGTEVHAREVTSGP